MGESGNSGPIRPERAALAMLSSFVAKKLDTMGCTHDDQGMVTMGKRSRRPTAARIVRERVGNGGERVWRMEDFRDLPFAAVAQALSRLARAGSLERLSKGIYYRSRPTMFGPSRPNPAAIQQLSGKLRTVHPAGLSAAHMLGFTTQNPARFELSTSANSLPRKLIGDDALVRTRRPAAWDALSGEDAACLEMLRGRGRHIEFSTAETILRMRRLLREDGRFNRLARVAATEPPRVRAILGALGESIRAPRALLSALRATLNPISRFSFGMFAGLPSAHHWQAKDRAW